MERKQARRNRQVSHPRQGCRAPVRVASVGGGKPGVEIFGRDGDGADSSDLFGRIELLGGRDCRSRGDDRSGRAGRRRSAIIDQNLHLPRPSQESRVVELVLLKSSAKGFPTLVNSYTVGRDVRAGFVVLSKRGW